MSYLDAEYRASLERLAKTTFMSDVLDSTIYPGDQYYEFAGGIIVKPENVAEWKDTGDIRKIMTALGREDEINDEFDEEFWAEEIFSWGVEEFLSQCDYDIHYA